MKKLIILPILNETVPIAPVAPIPVGIINSFTPTVKSPIAPVPDIPVRSKEEAAPIVPISPVAATPVRVTRPV